ELAIQADTADGNGRLAGQLTGPAGQIEAGAFEFRFPETPGRAVEDVHAGVGQRLEEGAQLLGAAHQARGVILLLPLGEAENDREVRADGGTHGPDQLDGEARAAGQVATVLVGALVAALP